MNIKEQSKILAEYLGWKYFPNNDLQGAPKAGWWIPLQVTEKVNTSIGEITLPILSFKGATKIGDGYYKYVCRSHKDLRFYNSFDELIPILNKLTEEDLSEYMYSFERCKDRDEEGCETEVCYNFMNIDYYISIEFGTIIEINLELDPSMEIGRGQGEDIVKNTFNACVQAVEYINKRKNEK